MKKAIMLLLAITMIFSFVAKSQVSGNFKSSINLSLDTLANATTKYMTVMPIAKAYPFCEAIVTLTNISGTTAATVTLEHSVDGTNYAAFPVDSVLTFSGAGTKGILWSGFRDKYIRVKFVGSGTQSTQIKATYSLR
jgi:hypothetical protein